MADEETVFGRGPCKSTKRKSPSGQPKKYGQNQQAEVIALACSDAPDGRARWTLELLVEALSKKDGFETINRETVRLMLKKTNASLG